MFKKVTICGGLFMSRTLLWIDSVFVYENIQKYIFATYRVCDSFSKVLFKSIIKRAIIFFENLHFEEIAEKYKNMHVGVN